MTSNHVECIFFLNSPGRGLLSYENRAKCSQAKSMLFKYLRETKEELSKVTWPSRKDILRYSGVVIAISIAFAIYFGALDALLNYALEALIKVTS